MLGGQVAELRAATRQYRDLVTRPHRRAPTPVPPGQVQPTAQAGPCLPDAPAQAPLSWSTRSRTMATTASLYSGPARRTPSSAVRISWGDNGESLMRTA